MTEPPAQSFVGRQLGAYDLLSHLGAGGMGEVYRARDRKLGRDVAIKLLPRAFADDPERITRFAREARVLAALNHPNIGAIYGLEEADGIRALVLELVEGPTLADRLRSGPLSIGEAIRAARQVAGALEAAHEKQIVHRDLKPANIKVTPQGTVKVLDFGIAKMLDAAADGLPESSTLTAVAATRAGVVLGTVAYMSPEQARGQDVDKRTDIWAFGCLLYEMLSGRSPFAGSTVSDTIGAILHREPDWTRLPGGTPPAVPRLIRRCLQKNASERLRDIGDARIELNEALEPGAEPAQGVPAPARHTWLPWAIAATMALVTLGVWFWAARHTGPATPPLVTRTTVTLPAQQQLDTEESAAPLAISPDGRRLAYVARHARGAQLYLRNLDAFDAVPLTGTDGARYPFFSADGESIAFFAGGRLKRISIHGGAPVSICDVPVLGRGGAWGIDGTIVFDPGPSGLMRVAASGGRPERLTSTDREMDGSNLSWPHFLPDGRTLLATLGTDQNSALVAFSLDSRTWRTIGEGFQAQYLSSGHVIFHAPAVREGELRAVAFDATRQAFAGTPSSVLAGVFRAENGGGAYFAVARNGTLVFARGSHARTLVRVDRNGRRTPVLNERRGYRMPAVSPDGKRIAVTIDPRPSQIWVYDFARQAGIPLATEGHNLGPIWTPDGRRVAFNSRGEMYSRTADGSSDAQKLLARERPQYPAAWSRDGRRLVYVEDTPATNSDIWMKAADSEPVPLLVTPALENSPRLSPDERWMAYASNESGRPEVYVRPFPNVGDGKWAVSTEGGAFPVWSRSGTELFYVNGTTIMAVAVQARGTTFIVQRPEALFSGPFETGSPHFDITPDGRHFIMVEADPDARPTEIQLTANWMEEIRRR
jgi:Tol biopolymer transport system component